MKNRVIIEKIISYAQKVTTYCEGVDKEEFIMNQMLTESCVFNLSQMGELANKLDERFTFNHKNIPWKAIYGLRNRIIHDYEGVNINLVWDVISQDLPGLVNDLKILSESIKE